MAKRISLIAAVGVAFGSITLGQEPDASKKTDPAPAAQPRAADAPASQPAATQSAGPLALNYSGDWLERPALTGDWGGTRNWLSESGITFDVQAVQYLQGNAYGGKSTNGAIDYGGTADYALNFDFQKMKLWPGGFARIRGETQFGTFVNGDVGSISAPNFDGLLPAPNDPGLTTLTEYWLMQFVSEKLGFIAGQVDLTGLPGGNVFASERYTQFMNTALWMPLNALSTVPYSAMTAGALYMPTKWLSGATLVADSYGKASYSGFESAFHSPQGVTILQSLTFKIKPGGLDGNQRISFSYSTRDKYRLDDLERLAISGVVVPKFDRLGVRAVIPGGIAIRPVRLLLREALGRAIKPSQESGDWTFWYDFDQYFYQDPADPKQGIGVFGRFGWSNGEFNPVSEFYSLGLGGRGLVPTRPRDRYGLGYYYVNMSNELPGIFDANAEQGVELFYNFEITPWLHITPDLQVIIDPGGNTGTGSYDPAIVYGLRMQLNF